MAKNNIPMDILSVVIYIWIFCLITLIIVLLFYILNFIIDATYVFVDLRKFTIGNGSMFWFLNIIYYYTVASTTGIVILVIILVIITLGIIILFLIWVALKDVFILKLLVRGRPFSTLKGVFNIMLESIPSKRRRRFVNYMQKHGLFMVKYLKVDEINSSSLTENFAVQNIIEKPHFSDEYNDEIGDEYKLKIKNNYFINAFKYNKQNEMAKNYKNMKIITPDSNYAFIENTSSYFSIKAETNINKMNIK